MVGDQLAYMFSAACKYQVLGLMAICEKQMEQNLTVANAAHCLSVADHVEAKSLKLACLKFIGYSSLVYYSLLPSKSYFRSRRK